MDITTGLGILIGFLAILLGNLLEGGHLSSLIQLTAFIIVFGGTMGATLVSNTLKDINTGLSLLKLAFGTEKEAGKVQVANEIVEATKIARQESLVALEKKVDKFSNRFMRDVFRLVVDGVDPSTIRDIFEAEMDVEERHLMAGAKVWTDAGGFAPTIGIIGAVLGLIHVMSNLSDTSELGKGIAVAFVATVYGVGSANLLFLPIGNKIKSKVLRQMESREMILEGAIALASGANQLIVAHKMQNYLDESHKHLVGI